MAYSLHIPIVKLYGNTVPVIDYAATTHGFDVTVRLSYDEYEYAQALRRLDLRVASDERIFKAVRLGDYDVSKKRSGEPSDIIIEFIGKKPKPTKRP